MRRPPQSLDAPLLPLMRAIAFRDELMALELLARAPLLASGAIVAGATREAPSAYYFDSISHYAYAGDTPLHMAAAAYSVAIADRLLASGANPRAVNRRGAEPLHYAADGSPGSASWNPEAQYSMVLLLIKAGADPNARDKSGVGPLHRAVRTRCTAAVRALLLNGAGARERNDSGSTPLHLAVLTTGRGGSGSPEAQEEQKKIIGLLLSHGAHASDKDDAGRSVTDQSGRIGFDPCSIGLAEKHSWRFRFSPELVEWCALEGS